MTSAQQLSLDGWFTFETGIMLIFKFNTEF